MSGFATFSKLSIFAGMRVIKAYYNWSFYKTDDNNILSAVII